MMGTCLVNLTVRGRCQSNPGKLNMPAVSMTSKEAALRFSWLAPFAGYDNPASSQLTQQRLGWRPTHPGLLEDLDREAYFRA